MVIKLANLIVWLS